MFSQRKISFTCILLSLIITGCANSSEVQLNEEENAKMKNFVSYEVFSSATEQFSKAKNAILLGENSKAYKMFIDILELLGDNYHDIDVIDDTGQMLVLAKHKRKNGELKISVKMLEGITRTRINSYERMLERNKQ